MPVPMTASADNNAFDDISVKTSPSEDANEYEYDFIDVEQSDDASVANDEYAYADDNVRQPSAADAYADIDADADADDGDIDDYSEPASAYEALPVDYEANPETTPPYESLRPDSSPQ